MTDCVHGPHVHKSRWPQRADANLINTPKIRNELILYKSIISYYCLRTSSLSWSCSSAIELLQPQGRDELLAAFGFAGSGWFGLWG